MTLEEIKALLEEKGLGSIYEGVVSLVEAEKQKGIAETSRRNKENQGLRKFKTALTALGYSDDGDVDDFVSSTLAKIQSQQGSGDQYERTIAQLNNTVKQMQEQLKQERTKAKASKLQEVLGRELNDKVYGSKFVVNGLISGGKVDLDDNGEVIFRDGELTKSFNDGIKEFLDNNKDIVKVGQHTGPGGKQVSSPGSNGDPLTLKDPEAIKGNLDAIKAKLNIKV